MIVAQLRLGNVLVVKQLLHLPGEVLARADGERRIDRRGGHLLVDERRQRQVVGHEGDFQIGLRIDSAARQPVAQHEVGGSAEARDRHGFSAQVGGAVDAGVAAHHERHRRELAALRQRHAPDVDPARQRGEQHSRRADARVEVSGGDRLNDVGRIVEGLLHHRDAGFLEMTLGDAEDQRHAVPGAVVPHAHLSFLGRAVKRTTQNQQRHNCDQNLHGSSPVFQANGSLRPRVGGVRISTFSVRSM